MVLVSMQRYPKQDIIQILSLHHIQRFGAYFIQYSEYSEYSKFLKILTFIQCSEYSGVFQMIHVLEMDYLEYSAVFRVSQNNLFVPLWLFSLYGISSHGN